MAKKIEFHDGTDKFEEGTITDTIVLISSDWNDYGFKMLFDVLYFDSEGNYINLGGTRIYPSRFDDLRKLTNFVKNSKSKQYCTVGEDIRFYYKVYNTLGDEEALNFLEEINDVTVFGIGKLKEIDTSIFNNYNKEDIPSIISSEYMKISKLEDFKKRTLFRLNSELYDLLYLRDKVLQENETKNIINFGRLQEIT
ncbi:hypothetical protein [Limosilactobacillus avium]|uniref:hypothetical protein n=1 Tax=Limosilactobacillus avium TaxID=2991831 RepID=UPI0024BAA7C8|nr:hypothetical protein [Limosilactobacillus avium]